MASCSACGVPRPSNDSACAACGATAAESHPAAPHFELDLPPRGAGPRTRIDAPSAPVVIDLAFDPREAFGPDTPKNLVGSAMLTFGATESVPANQVQRGLERGGGDDIAADARLLADHGPAPTHLAMTALYAWRVLRRRRDLRKALSVRRTEAARARAEVDDALAAFAERVRPTAETCPEYGDALDQLRRAEEVVRSRDRVLASEIDAHRARLASVDARIGKLESEREQARADERNGAAHLATAQAELARAEAELKRAESELRAATQRERRG